MEVINQSSKLLSNYEVLEMLRESQLSKKGQKRPHKDLQNLSTITYQTVKYLENTPAGYQNQTIIHDFLTALKPFALTKAEKLQLLNRRPCSAVEIQLLVEESEERLSEEQIDQLLQVVADILPGPPEDNTEVMETDSMAFEMDEIAPELDQMNPILYYILLFPSTVVMSIVFLFLMWMGKTFFTNN